MRIHAEFESIDIADIICSEIKSTVPGIHRISITDRSSPSPYAVSSFPTFAQGINGVQPYVTEISHTVNGPSNSPVKVEIICDPQSSGAIKRGLISKGGLSVRELS